MSASSGSSNDEVAASSSSSPVLVHLSDDEEFSEAAARARDPLWQPLLNSDTGESVDRKKRIQPKKMFVELFNRMMCSSSSTDPSSILKYASAEINATFQKYLAFYIKFVSTPANQDKLLKLMQWSLYMCSLAVMAKKRKSASSLHSSQWLHKLYGEVSWARYILRILQFPMALDAVLNHRWTTQAAITSTTADPSTTQRIYNVIGKVLSYSMLVYYPTELMAYLLWMKPPSPFSSSATTTVTSQEILCDDGTCILEKRRWLSLYAPPQPSTWTPEKWSYLSCRCWLAYVVAELIQCVVQYKELQQLSDKERSSEEDVQHQRRMIVLQGLRNAFFMLPCLQWSLPKWDTQPLCPTYTINTLMWFESLVSLYQAILAQRYQERKQGKNL